MTENEVKAAAARVLARTTDTAYCEDPAVLDAVLGPLVDEIYDRTTGGRDGTT
jgi:hypothetical protein